MNDIAFLFIGVVVGIFISKYICPVIDILLEVFTYRQSEKINESQLLAQAMVMDFKRDYPEIDGVEEIEEKAPLIGFQYDPSRKKQNQDEEQEEDY